MAKLRVVEAARAVGKSRHTIQRYCKNGTLSCTVDDDGRRVIDSSELLRVFHELKPPEPEHPEQSPEHGQAQHPPAPSKITELLEQQVATQQRTIERLEREKEEERLEYREREQKLLTMLERAQLQLTDGTNGHHSNGSNSKKPPTQPRSVGDALYSWLTGTE